MRGLSTSKFGEVAVASSDAAMFNLWGCLTPQNLDLLGLNDYQVKIDFSTTPLGMQPLGLIG